LYDFVAVRLNRFSAAGQQTLLKASQRGIEKESLRVSPAGTIAQTPHPLALGATLTNPHITTDYSEALLELITPPCADNAATLLFLRDTHQFVYSKLAASEYVWAASMPCTLEGEDSIPIGYYGSSNAGRMKTIYRLGLGHRYGKIMQVIAGVHFNYSLEDRFWTAYQILEGESGSLRSFKDRHYFGMIRNLQRHGWLIPYLFGASPAVGTTFLQDHRPRQLQPFDDHSYYGPYATSLRMGDIGYQNKKEGKTGVRICYDSLDSYVSSLERAISTPCPTYARIGVKVDGEYRQLNANILQIENEYYSSVRAKQPLLADETHPSQALRARGVGYIELRSLDVNAYDPLGIHESQLYFLEAFILFCLLNDSPPIAAAERAEIDWNQSAAAHQGRDPSLLLRRHGHTQLLRTWASELCNGMRELCTILDEGLPNRPYSSALETQTEVVHDTDQTPSARMLADMHQQRETFFEFTRRLSHQHRDYFQALPPNPTQHAFFENLAAQSLNQQHALETAVQEDFDHYLARYSWAGNQQ